MTEVAESPAEDPAAAPEKAAPLAEGVPAPPEPEVGNTISYDDYLAQKARPDSAAFRPVAERKLDANEFAGKAAAMVKDSEEFMNMGREKTLKKKGKNGKKEKQTLVVKFRAKAWVGEGDRGDGGGRGGRGEGRGRGSYGGRGGRDGGEGRGGRQEGGWGRGAGRGPNWRYTHAHTRLFNGDTCLLSQDCSV